MENNTTNQTRTAPLRHALTQPGRNHTLRTLNVIKEVPGIAGELQVNIAYDHAPGLTYLQAKEFEYALQMKIQAALDELSQRPVARNYPNHTGPRFIPIHEAMEITGHHTAKAFKQWRYRHQAAHPHSRIIYRAGAYEVQSVLRAVAVERGEVAA